MIICFLLVLVVLVLVVIVFRVVLAVSVTVAVPMTKSDCLILLGYILPYLPVFVHVSLSTVDNPS